MVGATVRMARSFRVAGDFVPAVFAARAAIAAAAAFLAAAATGRAVFAAAPVLPAAAALPTPFFSLFGVEHQRFAFVAVKFTRAIAHLAGYRTYPVAIKPVV